MQSFIIKRLSLIHIFYPINKRGDEKDDHFSVRGWFDVYCTQGETSTLPFKELERKYGFFKVYETGWCKADTFVKERAHTPHNARPVVDVYKRQGYARAVCQLGNETLARCLLESVGRPSS